MNYCNRIYLIALITLSSVSVALGQTYKNVEITPRSVAGSNAQQLSIYTSQFLKNNTAPTTSRSARNEIFIRQVGNNNQFTSEIRSAFSEVDAFQLGNNNQAYVDRDAVGVDEFILQRGNNNVIYDIGSGLNLLHRSQVTQFGTNQRLLVLGNNSLSDRMKINMKGNNQTVIVRNIKRQ
jgi:hypothetical protein